MNSSVRRWLRAFLIAAPASGAVALGLGWAWEWAARWQQEGHWHHLLAVAWDRLSAPASWLIILSILASLFLIRMVRLLGPTDPPRRSREGLSFDITVGCGQILLLIAVMAVVMIVPALLIFWTAGPHGYKRAIQVSALLVCLAGSIMYYLFNRQRLPSVADKVGFFTGVVLAPPTALEFLLRD